ncbi:uncharacterized protein PHACADRAFT_213128 [Phanerochaete carnosa HHB-10118-sp]|uniref:Protein phosphatase n=1 Tax=Phanerochaete carnosa (strain HHB-10118-sp) TaxID=650164 RepID=K5VIZ3_PHACS|nr:uncharacterized protein PHACADRAFT_213128 [Phanerochaete carnosa HHB-10118-sp]EKM51268.1 hypothetical protein PHACADRAFT_213128 [Phanerochaete carnosa HHB-10118-sp]
MKVHKRLYSAIPRPLAASSSAQPSAPVVRVRSNSACSSRSLYTASQAPLPFAFFDTPSPPPPSSRPGPSNYAVSTRLVAEVKEGHTNSGQSNAPQGHSQHSGPPPYPLAFSSGSSQSSLNNNASYYPLFYPYTSFGSSPLNASLESGSETAHPSKRQRTRYHLDVGAYGIPKHSRDPRAGRGGHMNKPFTSSGPSHEGSHAVQVGEDAYFIRENAMGIADGVGGWARAKGKGMPLLCLHHRYHPQGRPKQLGARVRVQVRYLRIDLWTIVAKRLLQEDTHQTPTTAEESEHGLLSQELDDSLEELADGLDVLMVLERAYDKTLHAHVIPPPDAGDDDPPNARWDAKFSRPGTSSEQAPSSMPHSAARSASPSQRCHPLNSTAAPVPLLEGSSTALLAILDHSTNQAPKPRIPVPLLPHQLRRAETVHTPTSDRGAVLRVAHLGDCMAMLIRDDAIVWRTEEMWWDFNTPVQLGPASSTRPRDAQVFAIPVETDDILVLASDGLSDNLWDEDILDEVVRFRRSFMSAPPPASASGAAMNNGLLRRSTLAGMLSEALCSRARCVSERKGLRRAPAAATRPVPINAEDEIPFARRAREQGRWFDGGKPDDICVLVAVVSPSKLSP